MTSLFSRTDQSVLGRWWWTVDRILLATLVILAICGVMLVATASPPVAERIGVGQYHFIRRHLIVLGSSLLLAFGISLLDLRTVWRMASLTIVGGMAAMLAVLFIGMEVKGAQRWLDLPGFSLQPSEFVKPAFAVVSGWFMARQKEIPEFPGHKIAAGLYALVVALLMLQPDFGMTFVVTCIYGAQVFLAGFPLSLIFALGGLAAGGTIAAYFTLDHVRSRVDRFLDPAAGDNYQIDKALEAFREGGILGVGPGQGTIKLAIPDAHADFIFAVSGEEMGMFFTIFLILLFAIIILRGFSKIMESDDMFVILAGGGLLTMVGLQAFIHMGANLHLLPAKGMTLPFVSYGGSSLLATGFSMGMLLVMTRRQSRSSVAKGSIVRRKPATGHA